MTHTLLAATHDRLLMSPSKLPQHPRRPPALQLSLNTVSLNRAHTIPNTTWATTKPLRTTRTTSVSFVAGFEC